MTERILRKIKRITPVKCVKHVKKSKSIPTIKIIPAKKEVSSIYMEALEDFWVSEEELNLLESRN